MYKNLYECFAHWYHGGQVYFIADTHFNDEETKELRKNNIPDDEIIKRINSTISNRDTLVILGDIGDVEYVTKLKGKKILIKGNHDKGNINYKRRFRLKAKCPYCGKINFLADWIDNLFSDAGIDYNNIYCDNCSKKLENYKTLVEDNHLFDEIYDGVLTISDKIILSHEPVDFKYAFNIHGHTHDNKQFQDNNHLNVCCEWIDYTPISLKEIVKSGKLKSVKNIHRECIDKK